MLVIALLLLALCLGADANCQLFNNRTKLRCINPRYFPDLGPSITRVELVCTPRKMDCDRSYPRLIVPANWLQRFPNLKSLLIQDCLVRKLPPLAFAQLPKLHKVVLDGVPVARLDENTFHNSFALTDLYLHRLPCLESFPRRLLIGQTRMHKIVFNTTNLSGIGVNMLLDQIRSTDSLKVFEWKRNLQSVTIPINTFKRLPLKILDLSYNKLSDLEFLENVRSRKILLEGNMNLQDDLDLSRYNKLRHTRHLNLRSIRLSRLKPRSLSTLTKANTLILSNNFLTSVSGDMFRPMRRLMDLRLSHNRLRTIPQSMEYLLHRPKFPVTLALENNPIHCNCELVWLLKYPSLSKTVKCETGVSVSTLQQTLVNLRLVDLRCRSPSPVVFVRVFSATKGGDYLSPFYNSQLAFEKELTKNGSFRMAKGQSVNLQCRSTGDPPPILSWHVVSTTLTKMPADRGSSSYATEIQWFFHQREIRYDRIVVVCLAAYMRAHKAYNTSLTITIYNDDPIIFLPTTRPAVEFPVAASSGSSTDQGDEELRVAAVNGSNPDYRHRTGCAPTSVPGPCVAVLLLLLLWTFRRAQ